MSEAPTFHCADCKAPGEMTPDRTAVVILHADDCWGDAWVTGGVTYHEIGWRAPLPNGSDTGITIRLTSLD